MHSRPKKSAANITYEIETHNSLRQNGTQPTRQLRIGVRILLHSMRLCISSRCNSYRMYYVQTYVCLCLIARRVKLVVVLTKNEFYYRVLAYVILIITKPLHQCPILG